MGQVSHDKPEWDVQFTFEHSNDHVRLSVDKELILGRAVTADTSNTIYDLTPYGAADYGVSRKHAVLRWQGVQLMIYDLGGGNGTILNGIRLKPDVGYRLNEGSVLYLGHLLINVSLNNEIGDSAIRARRPGFDMLRADVNAKGQRILLVEDDAGLTTLFRTVLEAAGFSVQVGSDVVSAMRALHQTTPSATVLDLMLPGIHGLELTRYIRRDIEGPEIPIIIVSAISDAQTIKESMEAGVDVYMSKPFKMRELVRVVSAVVGTQEAENPKLHTKLLRGTASLDFIVAGPRKDTVVLFVEGEREPIGAVVQPSLTLGRQSNSQNHVDLDAYGAFDKGVSRIHATLTRVDDKFMVTDSGSANGTFVNGHALTKNEIYPIKNGDELRLGELRMHVYLLADTGRLAEANPGSDNRNGVFA